MNKISKLNLMLLFALATAVIFGGFYFIVSTYTTDDEIVDTLPQVDEQDDDPTFTELNRESKDATSSPISEQGDPLEKDQEEKPETIIDPPYEEARTPIDFSPAEIFEDFPQWNTYKDEEGRFSFRYPLDWEVRTHDRPWVSLYSPEDIKRIEAPGYTDAPAGLRIKTFEASGLDLINWLLDHYELQTLAIDQPNYDAPGRAAAVISIRPITIGGMKDGYVVREQGIPNSIYVFYQMGKGHVGRLIIDQSLLEDQVFLHVLNSLLVN